MKKRERERGRKRREAGTSWTESSRGKGRKNGVSLEEMVVEEECKQDDRWKQRRRKGEEKRRVLTSLLIRI